jgi:hypothetical protein
MKQEKEQQGLSTSRRDFVKKGALAAAAFSIVPRHVLGKGFNAPSDTLYIATIGAGGKGESDTRGFMQKYDPQTQTMVPTQKAKIAFLCDVDEVRGGGTFKKYPDAKVYKDWRELLDKENKNFDAVSVSTPDHTHAVAASAAITLGKHIWVQKPMTHDIYEARVLAKLAREHKVVSQMGNQGSSGDGVRFMREWYEAGFIGDVTDVYCYTNRPSWPQGGIKWPTATGTPPATFDWNLWQSTAPDKPYPAPLNAKGDLVYPHNWRGWWDYGTGGIGDMGAHILEAPMTVLNLGFVTAAQSSVGQTSGGQDTSNFPDTCPPSSYTTLTFPNPKSTAKAKLPNIKIHWMDGGLMPPRPEEMEPTDTLTLADNSGMLFVGTKGKMIAGCYSEAARLLPVSRMEEDRVKKLAVKYPRVPGGANAHYQQWVEACLAGYGKGVTSSPFDKAAMVVENMLVANLAIRGFGLRKMETRTVASTNGGAPVARQIPTYPARNMTLLWDHDQMKVTNIDEVNQYVKREYRQGWHLSGV